MRENNTHAMKVLVYTSLFHFIVVPLVVASSPGRKNEQPGTHCMRMRSIPQNLGNPVISVNYCSFSRLENETSFDARLPSILTNVKIEGGRGYRPGSKPLYVTQETTNLLWPSYTYSTYVSVYRFE